MALARETGDRAREATRWPRSAGRRWGRTSTRRGARRRRSPYGSGRRRHRGPRAVHARFARAVSGGLDEARGAIGQALVASLMSHEWTARSLSLSAAGL